MIKTLAGQVKEFKKDSIITPIFMILEVIMEMIIPLLMSSIIDDKNKTIYVIKESVGGENKVSNIIEKLILKDIKNNLRSKEEVNHYDGN